MSTEVTRWLAEVRTLQTQLAAVRQERDQALASATNWQRLYETEARQRRTDGEHQDLVIKTLRAEVAALRGQLAADPPPVPTTLEAQWSDPMADLTTVEGLRQALTETLSQCDRLQRHLEAERARHAQTRETLTTALSEAIDAFKTGKPLPGS